MANYFKFHLAGSTNLVIQFAPSKRKYTMSNMPSIKKTKVSLQLDNTVIVALDTKAEQDGTSRNSVANYYLSNELERIINNFTPEQKAKVADMEKRNMEARNGK